MTVRPARSARRAAPANPVVPLGAAFGVPLGDGLYGLCRVIARATARETSLVDLRGATAAAAVLVLATRWTGTREQLVSATRDPRARKPLVVTHHGNRNKKYVICVHDVPPPDFVPVGELAPSPADARLRNVHFAWATLPLQYRSQLAWEANPDAVRAADRARSRASAAERERELAEIKAKRAAAQKARRLAKRT